jgi:putative transcription factor
MSSGQDFEPVTFGGGGKGKTASGTHNGNNGKGSSSAVTTSGKTAAQLDNDSESTKHATVSAELRIALQQARTAKKLTQKQLATQLNMQVQIINEYESGKAVPNNQVISKFERALCAKLPRVKKQ